MKVAVYSGSFNPLHIGHLAIMKHLTQVAGFDMVYLIVSPKNPLKDGISSASGRERYQAAVEAVNRHFATQSEMAVCGDDMPPPARGWMREAQTGVIGISLPLPLSQIVSFNTFNSLCRNPNSPSVANISGILRPATSSTTSSKSIKRQQSSSESLLPTLLLPHPINPINDIIIRKD